MFYKLATLMYRGGNLLQDAAREAKLRERLAVLAKKRGVSALDLLEELLEVAEDVQERVVKQDRSEMQPFVGEVSKEPPTNENAKPLEGAVLREAKRMLFAAYDGSRAGGTYPKEVGFDLTNATEIMAYQGLLARGLAHPAKQTTQSSLVAATGCAENPVDPDGPPPPLGRCVVLVTEDWLALGYLDELYERLEQPADPVEARVQSILQIVRSNLTGSAHELTLDLDDALDEQAADRLVADGMGLRRGKKLVFQAAKLPEFGVRANSTLDGDIFGG